MQQKLTRQALRLGSNDSGNCSTANGQKVAVWLRDALAAVGTEDAKGRLQEAVSWETLTLATRDPQHLSAD